MSLQGANWARKVPSSSPGPRILLMELGLLADEVGACFPSLGYLAEATCQSADTVRRQLKKFEAAGVLVAFKREHANGRQRSNEYRLALDRDPQSFAGLTDGGDVHAALAQEITASIEPEGGEGGTVLPLHGARGGLHQMQGGGLHQMPPLESTSYNNTPLPPAVPIVEGLPFSSFREKWIIPGDASGEAAWSVLAETEREVALQAIGQYEAVCARLKTRPKLAATFLKNRLFDDPKLKPPPPSTSKWVVENSEQWHAWLVFARCYGKRSLMSCSDGRGGKGWTFAAEWPPIGRGLHLPSEAEWTFIPYGSQQSGAWLNRLREVREFAMAGWPAGPDPAKLEGVSGFFAPSPWPPRKDGSTGPPSDEADGPSEAVRAADEAFLANGDLG